MRRHGGGRVMARGGICIIEGCALPTHGGGLCNTHYRRRARTGDASRGRPPAKPKPPRNRRPTTEERFWAKVERTETCWLWRGHIAANGYGSFSLGHRESIRAHRYTYELYVGHIPEGLSLDHLCRVRNCVNPIHLEAVPIRENHMRAPATITAQNVAKTGCPRGHPYSGFNSKGGRICQICDRVLKQARRARAHQSLA